MTDPVNKLIDDMDKARFDGASGMLRIVLQEIQNGGVVDWAYKYYDDLTAHKAIVLKPDFANFLAERE